MGKILKITLLAMLAMALAHLANDVFTDKAVSIDQYVDVERATGQDVGSFETPQWPYLPDVELITSNGHVNWLTSPRLHRSLSIAYILSLKERVGRLARCEAALALHRQKLYDASAYRPCSPVSEYYVFTLRRILI